MYFFDLDGTMLDSNGIWLDIDIRFLGKLGISPVPQSYTDFVTHHSFPESAVYTKECFALSMTPEEIIDGWREMASEAYGGALPLKPGVKQLLQHLHGKGERLAVLTSCIPELCMLALERHGILPFFEKVLTTSALGLDKRSAELYKAAADRCGVKPQDCIFFDDNPAYCAGAKRAGLKIVGVADGLFAHRAEEMRAVCDLYIESLTEFHDAL